MKEASWNDCLESHSSVKVSSDKARARSLIETSDARISLIKEVNEENCNFVFEDYYTSLLELLQVLVAIKGYKVTNHICLGYYIRDILDREDLYVLFDDIRYKRHSLTYYGQMMDFDNAMLAISKCKKLIKEIKILIKL